MSLRKELGQDHLAFLPQLGLICIRHALGRLQNNDEDLNTILGFLNKANLDGLEDPFNTIWVCYRILSDLQDHRADGLLVKAYTLLLAQAGKIPDDFSRQSFLINIPEHRLIVETAISSNIAPDVNYRMDS